MIGERNFVLSNITVVGGILRRPKLVSNGPKLRLATIILGVILNCPKLRLLAVILDRPKLLLWAVILDHPNLQLCVTIFNRPGVAGAVL